MNENICLSSFNKSVCLTEKIFIERKMWGQRSWTFILLIIFFFLWCPDIEWCLYWKVRDQITFKWLLHVAYCTLNLFMRLDLWFSSHCLYLYLALNVSIWICSVVIGTLLCHSILPRLTEKIPSTVLFHGDCGLLTTIAISVLLHTASPFASWCLFWMIIIYTVWSWLHVFSQKQSKCLWKYSSKCLWALELFYIILTLNLIFFLLTSSLLKGSVPAKIPEDSTLTWSFGFYSFCGFYIDNGLYIDKLWFAIAYPVDLLFFFSAHP